VIVDQGDGVAEKLAIVDYKTSTNSTVDYHLQLQVYASAAKREGLEVSEAILHDLKEAKRVRVPIDDRSLEQAEQRAKDAADRIRRRRFKPRPALSRCRRCEVRTLCSDAEH
jgi:DNA helicase-2/ATP-dependent DNA helicase PcrA